MFDAPEYRSYIALCRELRLKREFDWGDWFVDIDSWSPRGPSLVYPDARQVGDRIQTRLTETRTNRTVIWLPRLDQWLVILEEALALSYRRTAGSDPPQFLARSGWARRQALTMLQVRAEHYPDEPVEEASARLWMAVVGREVRA